MTELEKDDECYDTKLGNAQHIYLHIKGSR
jgi:hypothetical protein